MIHKERSPLAGQIVTIKYHVFDMGGKEFCVEDWWDRVSGRSWQDLECEEKSVCLDYACRIGAFSRSVPGDDEVLYGTIDGYNRLVHVSEIVES